MFGNLFSANEINLERNFEWDFIKVISIICMILSHCVDYGYLDTILGDNITYFFSYFLGGPLSAPVFMFCMGLGMLYTRHNTPKDFIKRGVYLLIIGFILNLILFILALIIAELYLPIIYGDDILIFAGITFIIFGLFKKLKLNHIHILIIAIILSIISTIIPIITIENPILAQLVCYFFPVYNTECYFPLFNWILFPASAYFFAYYFKRCNNIKKLYTLLLPLFIICMPIIIYQFINYTGIFIGTECYGIYFMSFYNNIVCIGLTLSLIAIAYFLSPYIPKKEAIIKSSKNITNIYFAQYIIIFTIPRILVLLGLINNILIAFVLILIIMGLSFYIGNNFIKLKIPYFS
ncbi:MAG: hypothetical protein Q4P14_05705 [Methanobacteriaceae archaeon]|nr:hypothetical protein [Methanobacteriaceae archaeon]